MDAVFFVASYWRNFLPHISSWAFLSCFILFAVVIYQRDSKYSCAAIEVALPVRKVHSLSAPSILNMSVETFNRRWPKCRFHVFSMQQTQSFSITHMPFCLDAAKNVLWNTMKKAPRPKMETTKSYALQTTYVLHSIFNIFILWSVRFLPTFATFVKKIEFEGIKNIQKSQRTHTTTQSCTCLRTCAIAHEIVIWKIYNG